MRTPFVRTLQIALPLLLVTFAACGPSDLVGKTKLKDVHVGTKEAEAVKVMGTGPLKPNQPGDSLRLVNGFRTQAFLVDGQTYRILWYRERPGSIEELITRESETPVLLRGDAVLAVGWSDFDSNAEKLHIPNPYRNKEHMDSIVKAQAPK